MNGGLFSNGTGPSLVDVPAIFDSRVPELIAGIVQMGCLVAIGCTRDRGSLHITITSDGDYDRTYVRSSDEAMDYLERAADTLRSMGLGDQPAVPDRVQTPTRRRQKLA
jgi:hypothetical protein